MAASAQESRRSGAMSGGMLLFRVSGVPVLLSPSWWLGSLVVVVLYAPLVRELLPSANTLTSWLLAAAFAVLLGLSVLAHELGHCVVALRLGIPVRKVRLFLLGGLAEVSRTPREPGQEGAIAAAGPIVSVLLAGLCGTLLFMVPSGGILWLLVAQCTVANLVVGLFNLLPGLPLDGGRMLRAVVWAGTGERGKGTKAAVAGGGVVAASLMVWAFWGVLSGSEDRWLRLGVCLVTAWFVLAGANAELAADSRHLSSAFSLTDVMRPMVRLPAEITVSDALTAASGRAVMLVRADGVAAGLLNFASAERLAAVSPTSPAELAAESINPEIVLLFSDSGEDIVERVRETASWQFLAVDDEGQPVGVLHREDLHAAIEHGQRPG